MNNNKTTKQSSPSVYPVRYDSITWWLVPLGGFTWKCSSHSSSSSLQLAKDELLLQELCMDITNFHTLLDAGKGAYISCYISQYQIRAFLFVPCHVSDANFVVKFTKNSCVSTENWCHFVKLPSRKDFWNCRLKLELWEIQNGGKIVQNAVWKW